MSAEAMQNLLKEFGDLIGIPELCLDEENRCNLMFDDVAVSFELNRDEESFYMYSYLGDASSENRERVYAKLLDANYVFKHTNGATLGVEDASKKIILIRQYALEMMRLSKFESVVEEFVNLAEYWKQKIPTLALAQEQAPFPDEGGISEAHAMKV